MRHRVMRKAAIFFVMLPLAAPAQEAPHHHGPASAPIEITISPEARVSAVAMPAALPPRAACGTRLDLPVKIINQAFVTSHLEARLVDNVPAGVTLDFRPKALTGAAEEMRLLSLVLRDASPVDVTLAFKERNGFPDLGGRDRIHFLLRCQALK
jgi:hypothetical protein